MATVRSKLLYLCSDQSESEKKRLNKHLHDFSFTCAAELVATSNEESSLRSTSLPEAPVYYTVNHLGVDVFIQPEVVRQLVRVGSMVALSQGTFIDRDDVVAVLPSGTLILSLQKESYEQFGIVGKPSAFQRGHRYVVEIDLLADHFRPGKPNYERLKVALTKNLPLKMDFLLAVDPQSRAGACIESLLKASRHVCVVDVHKHHTKTPLFQPGEDSSCSPTEFYTWLGTLSNDIAGDAGGPGVYESSFSTAHLSGTTQYITRHRWTGMVHPSWLQTAVESARGVASSCSRSNSALQVVHAWGFEDAPVSQSKLEHSYFLHGENMLSVAFTGSQAYIFKSVATYDQVQ